MALVGRSSSSRSSRGLVLAYALLEVTAACGGRSHQPQGAGGSDAHGGTAGSAGASAGTMPLAGAGGSIGGGGSGEAGKGGAGGAEAAGGGDGGIAGTAGTETAGSGGTADAGAAGAPSGGTAGNAGDAGSAGSSGSAGMPALDLPECETADDCRMTSDCCGCRSEPRDAPGTCALACVRDACAEEGIAPTEVACSYGRCVIARRCDVSFGCPALPEACPEGLVRSTVDDCFGACIPATECQRVGSCASCGDAFCVEFQAQHSSFSCVDRVESCDRENYCECLGVCGTCTEADDGVVCPCLGC